MKILNKYELAWCAGFFDGEGCTYTDGTAIRLSIAQNDKRSLLRFQKAVGVGNINGPYTQRKATKPIYKYTINNFEHVQAVIGYLWKYLGEQKREQARDKLTYYKQFKRSKVGRKPHAITR